MRAGLAGAGSLIDPCPRRGSAGQTTALVRPGGPGGQGWEIPKGTYPPTALDDEQRPIRSFAPMLAMPDRRVHRFWRAEGSAGARNHAGHQAIHTPSGHCREACPPCWRHQRSLKSTTRDRYLGPLGELRAYPACVGGGSSRQPLLPLCLPAPARRTSCRDRSWHLSYLHVVEAHAASTGKGVNVAVVDSGVNAYQPELSGSVLSGIDPGRGMTGNGQQDGDGHGTAMATLIAGHGRGPDSRDGILGIAPEAKILPDQ